MGVNLKKLNARQREAVTCSEGPVLVVAGAGTGKTRTIAFRTALLMERGAAPENILGITFTNKAARGMRERVSALIGREESEAVTLCTVHSLCARLLREHIPLLGREPDFSIFDASDQLGLMRESMLRHGLDPRKHDPRSLLFRFGQIKNDAADSADVLSDARARAIFENYNRLLESNNALDFDDLLLFTLRLVEEHEQARRAIAERFRHIMVDEYQDINTVQYRLLRAVALEHRNFYAVGDEDQSIYGWRGARLEPIRNFEKDFPGARVVKLEQNYRSTTQILDAAHHLIVNNPDRRDKRLRSARGPGFSVNVLAAATDRDEAASVIERIISEKHKTGLRFSAFAVLFRTNAQTRLFEEVLMARNIAYVLVGGTKFYERKEIKDMLSYLRFAANPQDASALDRIINYPTRGIGAKSREAVFDFAVKADMPPGMVLHDPDLHAQLPDRAAAGLKRFVEVLEAFRTRSQSPPLADSVRRLIQDIDLEGAFKKAYENVNEARRRFENVQEMVSSLADYESAAPEPSLAGFLENAALLTDEREADEDLREDSVALMTLHSCKGLEFPVVFMAGVEEGMLPHERSMETDAEIQEERRLMYVGMTRAMKRLFISWTRTRRRFGEKIPRKPSRFLEEISAAVEYDDPDELKSESEATYHNIAEKHLERMKKMFD